MALRLPLEAHFEFFWALVAKWLSGGLWNAHFELFWTLVAKWLSGGLWRLILSSSGLWWPNGSQVASGGSF